MLDLHMHSLYSDDGEYSPARLAEMCAAGGVRLMSVTDHNCVKANPEAAQAAERLGVGYIAGTEIDCVFGGANFHLLGYGIDSAGQDFADIQANVEAQECAYSLQALEATRALGFDLTEDELYAVSADGAREPRWTGEMFAEALLRKPEYAEHPLLAPYRAGGARSDNPYVNFYWDYYAQGKPCYVPMTYPSLAACVETIHRNGGIAVLAHPAVNLRGREALLDGILRLGLDGIEAYSSYHTPEQVARFRAVAEANGLLCTCGSDFHGKTKPSVTLGKCSFPEDAAQEQRLTDALLARLNGR